MIASYLEEFINNNESYVVVQNIDSIFGINIQKAFKGCLKGGDSYSAAILGRCDLWRVRTM